MHDISRLQTLTFLSGCTWCLRTSVHKTFVGMCQQSAIRGKSTIEIALLHANILTQRSKAQAFKDDVYLFIRDKWNSWERNVLQREKESRETNSGVPTNRWYATASLICLFNTNLAVLALFMSVSMQLQQEVIKIGLIKRGLSQFSICTHSLMAAVTVSARLKLHKLKPNRDTSCRVTTIRDTECRAK